VRVLAAESSAGFVTHNTADLDLKILKALLLVHERNDFGMAAPVSLGAMRTSLFPTQRNTTSARIESGLGTGNLRKRAGFGGFGELIDFPKAEPVFEMQRHQREIARDAFPGIKVLVLRARRNPNRTALAPVEALARALFASEFDDGKTLAL